MIYVNAGAASVVVILPGYWVAELTRYGLDPRTSTHVDGATFSGQPFVARREREHRAGDVFERLEVGLVALWRGRRGAEWKESFHDAVFIRLRDGHRSGRRVNARDVARCRRRVVHDGDRVEHARAAKEGPATYSPLTIGIK